MTVPVFPVVPTVQRYDWGKIGLQSKVAQFADAAGFKVDAKAPYAEVRRLLSFVLASLKKCLLVSYGWVLIRSRRRFS